MTARSEGAGHGPRGAAARHHPHGAQRRDCTRRSLRHPVLPFDARHVRCQRRAARHPRLAGLASAPAARPSARSSCRTLGQRTELDETNNAAVTAALPMTPYLPDLLLTAVTVPATARGGRSLAITHAVRNAGPAPAGAFAIRFYLTGDDALAAATSCSAPATCRASAPGPVARASSHSSCRRPWRPAPIGSSRWPPPWASRPSWTRPTPRHLGS